MRDLLTGLPVHEQAGIGRGGGQRQPGGEVYQMVLLRSQGLSRSDDRAVLPGGAYPHVPGLASGTEVYQWVADTSHGIGYGPGGAMVSTPFFPG
jgi:hypothetical protein